MHVSKNNYLLFNHCIPNKIIWVLIVLFVLKTTMFKMKINKFIFDKCVNVPCVFGLETSRNDALSNPLPVSLTKFYKKFF